MWTRYIANGPFQSNRRTGKWLFDVPLDRADAEFARIEAAVRDRDIPAAKRASPRLEALLGPGFTILLAYVADKDPVPVGEALARLRAHGIDRPGRFKCDEATLLGRERVAYLTEDFEGNGPADAGMPGAGDLVLLKDGSCLDLVLTRGDREGTPWGVGYEIELGGRHGPILPESLLDPRERAARRRTLARIGLLEVARVSGAPGRDGLLAPGPAR